MLNNFFQKNVDPKENIKVIKPESGWRLIDLKELASYRDLFFFLVWRDITVFYAQTIMGFAWAIVQPLIQIIIFTIIFGKVAKLSTDGIPYFVFSSAAIIPWTYMSQSLSQASNSLITGKQLLGKIYFPRLFFPMTPVLAKLVDFFISIVIIVPIFLFYKITPTLNLLYFPFFLLMMVSISMGTSLWLSAFAIRFRDVKHALPFIIRMLMYSAPIVYSASTISGRWKFVYSLNPIVGVVEGFRSCLLGTVIPWNYILPGMMTSVILLISGLIYFNKMEKYFVDVI